MSDLERELTTTQFFADPYPLYDRLRFEVPVYFSERWDCWLLTRYRDADAVLRDTHLYTNVGRIARFLDTLDEDDRAAAKPLYAHFSAGINHSDPPDHTRIRALVHKAFTPRAAEQARDSIQKTVDGLIDAAEPTGRIDLIGDLAYPLPAIVFAQMFGLPTDERDRFKAWSDQIVAFHGTGRADADVVRRSQEALLAARRWMAGLVEDRRKQPRDDVLTALALAEEQGRGLSETELLSTCITFMVGGHETTTNLVGNGMLALLRHPDQLQRLRENPDLIDGAVEEMLRYDAPTQRAQRLAAQDHEIDGVLIRRGQRVEPVLGAANRDPERFEEPNRFDITRRKNAHLAFGVGIHFCVGAALARLEGRIAVETLLRRLPALRLCEDAPIEWHHNSFFRGMMALHLTFDSSTAIAGA
jgi:cytochrome P450